MVAYTSDDIAKYVGIIHARVREEVDGMLERRERARLLLAEAKELAKTPEPPKPEGVGTCCLSATPTVAARQLEREIELITHELWNRQVVMARAALIRDGIVHGEKFNLPVTQMAAMLERLRISIESIDGRELSIPRAMAQQLIGV